MTSTETSRQSNPVSNPQEEGGDASGLADVLAGLTGIPQSRGDLASALQGLLGQPGGSETDLQTLLAQLVKREGADDETSAVTLAARSGADTAQLSPELLGALEKSPSSAQASAVPDALKRAVEALGLPPVLVEKLLPAIMERFSSASSGSQEKPSGAAVRKRSKSGSTTAKKPRARASKPAAASSSRAKSSSSAKSRSSSKTRKSGTSGGASKGTGKRSSGSSSSTGKRRSKRQSTPDVPGLEDIIKGLIR